MVATAGVFAVPFLILNEDSHTAAGADVALPKAPERLKSSAKSTKKVRAARMTTARRPDPAGGSLSRELRANEERERARRRLEEDGKDTYIAEILLARDSTIVRWADRDEPLRIWIRDTTGVEIWRSRFAADVRQAFTDWEASGIPLRFEFVSDSSRADIQVTWTERFSKPVAGRPISGLTRWGVDEKSRIVDAVITLALRRPGGDVLSNEAVHAMALHEIGHAIGMDHCTDARSVMAPTVLVRTLSAADVRTARLLYSLPPGTLH